MSLHVTCVATHSDEYFPILLESCNKHGIDLEVLGFGKKWGGFTMKINLIREYLNTLSNDDIVFVIDAFDVIVLQNKETMYKRFKEANKPIIISLDGDSDEIDFMLTYYRRKIFQDCRSYYLNAGAYCGYVYALKELFSKICTEYNCSKLEQDDQVMLSNICNQYENKDLDLDLDSNIFLTLFRKHTFTNDIDFQRDNDGHIVNKLGIEPCFIHCPGGANLDKVARLYNYNIDSIIKKKPKENFSAIITRVPLYYHFFKMELTVCFLLILTSIITIYLKYYVHKYKYTLE